jgi:sec-independent protein translocase protein TatA
MQVLAIFSMPGHTEWLVILVIALLIFGKRLPELARSVGKSLTEFKKGINEAKESTDELVDDVRRPAATRSPTTSPPRRSENRA